MGYVVLHLTVDRQREDVLFLYVNIIKVKVYLFDLSEYKHIVCIIVMQLIPQMYCRLFEKPSRFE